MACVGARLGGSTLQKALGLARAVFDLLLAGKGSRGVDRKLLVACSRLRECERFEQLSRDLSVPATDIQTLLDNRSITFWVGRRS